MATLGYPRVVTGSVYLGNIPPSVITYDGMIPNATYTDSSSARKIELTHTAIPYTNYVVIARLYANDSTTNTNNPFYDSDANGHWIQVLSTTSTRILTQYNAAGDGSTVQQVGYFI